MAGREEVRGRLMSGRDGRDEDEGVLSAAGADAATSGAGGLAAGGGVSTGESRIEAVSPRGEGGGREAEEEGGAAGREAAGPLWS